TKEKGDRLYISGGIYIFGRVENDEDREWYRKQIYEFIQFMKETGTFEYVDLDIEVIDEKVLSENFKNNEILKNNLLENRKSWEKDEKDTKNYRDTKKLFLKEIKVNSNEILKNINEINKSQIKKNSLDWSYYNLLLYTKIYSLKYIKSNSIKGEKEKEYNKITDIEFDMGGYY
ncbi:hypothetical protein ABC999_15295, partial [Fusobacterium varium]